MKFLLISFTDTTNFGDQFIVETLKDRLENFGDVVTYSYDLKKNVTPISMEDYSKYKNHEEKNFFKRVYHSNTERISILGKISMYRSTKKLKKNIRNSSFIDDLVNCDVVVFGGGNTIFDLLKFSDSAGRYNQFINIAKRYKKTVYFMDVGIGPFVTKQQLLKAKKVLIKADYITVRDNKSFELLKGLNNVQLAIDPVFLLPKEKQICMKSEFKTIGISVINLELNKNSKEEYLQYIKHTEQMIKEIGVKINNSQIVVFNSEIRDYNAILKLKERLENKKNIKFQFVGSKEQLLLLYNNLDLIIGTRMHSMIVGISQGIPVIGLSWQPKVREMFRIVNDEKSVFDINNFQDNIDIIIDIAQKKLKESSNDKFLELFQDRAEVDITNLFIIEKKLRINTD